MGCFLDETSVATQKGLLTPGDALNNQQSLLSYV